VFFFHILYSASIKRSWRISETSAAEALDVMVWPKGVMEDSAGMEGVRMSQGGEDLEQQEER
jgi:hypothetical protein